MWRSVLSAILASAIIVSAYVYIPVTPASAPISYEIAVPAQNPVQQPPPPPKPASVAEAKVALESLELNMPDKFSSIVRTPQVIAKARFSNKGTIKGTYKAELLVDGKVAQTRELVISPGTQEETFNLVINEFGKHTLKLGDKSCIVRIVEPGVPMVKKETQYATFVFNHGMEDALAAHTRNIEIAYDGVSQRIGEIKDRLTVYVYVDKEDTAEGIRTVSNSPEIAERYYRSGVIPEPIDDVMHGGSGSIQTCISLFSMWALKKNGLHVPNMAWLEVGMAEQWAYVIGRDNDQEGKVAPAFRARIERLKQALDEGKLMSLADMEGERVWLMRTEDNELGPLEYDEAQAMVASIVKYWGGIAKCRSILKEMLKGKTSTEAVYSVLTTSYAKLEVSMQDWINEQYNALPTPTPTPSPAK